MIKPEELVICKQRGHKTPGRMANHGWMQCEACGMWVRDTVLREEREDEPPLEEIDKLAVADRTLKDLLKRPPDDQEAL